VVTGANSGIGFETSIALAKMGAQVIMVARNPKLGQDALTEVIKISSNRNVELMLCDFSSLANVRKLAQEIITKCPKLDILVNNAGKTFGTRGVTVDGFEWTFGVNHLAPFLLTNLLLPLLKKSAPARIVNTASVAHIFGHINFKDIMAEKKYAEFTAYAQSKLANVLFSAELSKKLAGTHVTSNSLHPGVVGTHFAAAGGTFLKIFYSLFKLFMKTPAEGAKTTIYLASSPEAEGVTGKYFSNCKAITPSKEARDASVAKRLWELSEKLTGI
jgi:NAD(P)-dependent dehydrogenase (short-subunit alcohol dehydrogenase family)